MNFSRRIVSLLTAALMISLGFVAHAPAAAQSESGTPAEICENALPASDPETREYSEPEQVLELGLDYRAIFCTEAGAVYVNLYQDYTPVTVNSFVFLAQNGYYNNTTFHRVLEDFMAQGGDPTGTGGGGPGYQINDEFRSFLRFDRTGQLAMANANRPEQGVFNTNGSQFFLTTSIPDYLDFRHTIFGEVLDGQDVVEDLRLRDPQTNPTEDGADLFTVIIITEPDTVDFEEEPAVSATESDMLEAFEVLNDLPGVELDEAVSGALSTSDVVGLAAESVQDDVEALLSENDHEFSIGVSHVNVTCDLQNTPFEQIGYVVHAFPSRVEAAAVMQDARLVGMITGDNEFELIETPSSSTPVYTWETTACEQAGIAARMYQQYGRYVTVAETVFPADSPFGPVEWLEQVVRFQIYEFVFGDVFLSEIAR